MTLADEQRQHHDAAMLVVAFKQQHPLPDTTPEDDMPLGEGGGLAADVAVPGAARNTRINQRTSAVVNDTGGTCRASGMKI
jgi:hypothetical protein